MVFDINWYRCTWTIIRRVWITALIRRITIGRIPSVVGWRHQNRLISGTIQVERFEDAAVGAVKICRKVKIETHEIACEIFNSNQRKPFGCHRIPSWAWRGCNHRRCKNLKKKICYEKKTVWIKKRRTIYENMWKYVKSYIGPNLLVEKKKKTFRCTMDSFNEESGFMKISSGTGTENLNNPFQEKRCMANFVSIWSMITCLV